MHSFNGRLSQALTTDRQFVRTAAAARLLAFPSFTASILQSAGENALPAHLHASLDYFEKLLLNDQPLGGTDPLRTHHKGVRATDMCNAIFACTDTYWHVLFSRRRLEKVDWDQFQYRLQLVIVALCGKLPKRPLPITVAELQSRAKTALASLQVPENYKELVEAFARTGEMSSKTKTEALRLAYKLAPPRAQEALKTSA